MDQSALYRLRAVLKLFAQQQIDVLQIHQYIQSLQQAFLRQIDQLQHPLLNRATLLMSDEQHHGHFLTFKLSSTEIVSQLSAFLRQHDIITDYRADRLRFGFALYHNADEYDLGCLAKVTKEK